MHLRVYHLGRRVHDVLDPVEHLKLELLYRARLHLAGLFDHLVLLAVVWRYEADRDADLLPLF